jgi:multisubunit Na+/H+ antiporter MnhC subunit
MDVLFALASFFVAVIGFFLLSEATMGVGIIGLAAIIAVYARLVQAGEQHRKLMAQLKKDEG